MTAGPWREQVPLGPMTSWQIGGPARAFAEPKSPGELIAVRREADRRGWPVFLLGGGSNLLIADQGYTGLVIRYAGRSRRIDPEGPLAIVHTEGRTPLAGVARETARAGWAGLQWAEGIPGTVAGAIIGNAGAYGGDIASTLESLEVIHADGQTETWQVDRMDYQYRSSVLKGRDPSGPAIVTARFQLTQGDREGLVAELDRITADRKSKTPVGASCGSVFRNPSGDSAGRLIDLAGCKGMEVGPAIVSPQHANYILNRGGATASEVRELIETIRDRVRAQFSVELELEIQLIGFRDAS